MNGPERLAAAAARPLLRLARLAGPVVAVLGASTDAVLRLLGVRRRAEAPVTEEELRLLLRQGAAAGVFEPGEPGPVAGVLSLADRPVGELMTPRPQLVALDLDDPPEVNARAMAASPHTHLPVYRGDLDALVGLVSVKDVWAAALAAPAAGAGSDRPPAAPADTPVLAALRDLERLARPPLYVPGSLRALRLLEVFRRQVRAAGAPGPAGVAIVVGEHGGTEGLVTLTDLLDAIAAALPADGGAGPPGVVRRADGSWLVDGELDADALKAHLGLEAAPDPDRDAYHTVGGFVMQRLGRVPAAGDAFEWQGRRFEVVDMDGHRVDKVLVGPAPDTPPGPPRAG